MNGEQVKPQTYEERLVEKSIKTMEKNVEEQTQKRLQSGQSPEEILSALMQSIGQKPSSENLIGELSELAKTPVGTGERMGLIPSLLKGQGMSRPEKTEPLGMGKAIQVMGLQQQMEKAPGEQMKTGLEIVQKLLDLQKETPEGQDKEIQQAVRKQTALETAKEQQESGKNVRIANNKLALTLNRYEKMVKTTQELSKQEPGRFGGAITSLFGMTGKNPDVAPFKGSLVETAIAIAKIAAPSSRPGPEFARMMMTTLPNNFSNMQEARGQIITSMVNSFANYAATHPEEFPEGFDIEYFENEATNTIDRIANRESELVKKMISSSPSKTADKKVKETTQQLKTTSSGNKFRRVE